MTELAGARLLLRPFRPTDEAAVHRYASDPEVTRYTDWGPNTPEETAEFVRSVVDPLPSIHPFAVVVRAEDELIGAAEVRVLADRGELGYTLARPWWGRGYATEATTLLVDHAFGTLGLHRIDATCDPDNLASARVLTKAGFRPVGRLPDHLLVRGRWRDSLLFRLEP
ncbi:GNAT family N-acetyltransferase [Cryptosporangium phraense]|uniref:GNAT family N-acetyltransferase n=1 Tax=Cryptosporangium phraense TaxID=2593070 RepID=UPI00197AD286|nr:GNAT family N-acetyltransferase [Cryptosporangium phraense]